MRLLARCAATLLIGAAGLWSPPSFADDGFSRWVAGFWPVAHDAGITRPVFDAAFRGVTPDPEVLEKANAQAEFVKPLWEYVSTVVSDKRIATGRAMLQQHRAALDAIEARYGVDRYTLVAIWGIESSYGDALDDPKKVKSVVRSLATLAYADPDRAKFGRQQLIATLKILQHGDVSIKGLTGSWAGAMGHTQFIPTTYNGYAVDFDGDGRRNIWTNPEDALASSANYLAKSGWVPGTTWGYEVVLPAGFRAPGKDGARTVAEWQRLGVRRAGTAGFPRGTDRATLVAGGDGGPAFLMLKNHYVIKRYNNATAYALAVGHLADRLRGGGEFVHNWPQAASLLSEAEGREVQEHLTRAGYYQGDIDGAFGPESRAAIRAYQEERGLAADGRPDVDLLKILRGG
jgi:membrane-bound lytic murein transglycosylase B